MPVEVIMPKVDMDMASGKISQWFVEEGGAVTSGALLFEIETDKAAMEVEAEADGLLHHRAAPGREIAIGQPCAWLYAEGETVGPPPVSTDPGEDAPPQVSQPEIARHDAQAPAPTLAPAAQDVSSRTTRATPRARALAADQGLDVATLHGSGPRGRVQALDVPQPAAQASAPPLRLTPETGPLSIRRHGPDQGTPIVLIHGFASDGQSWRALETHLTDHPIIRIDLPCHGTSPKRIGAGFADLAQELRHAFDDLHLHRAHIVGHSLGGALALALADTRPRKIAQLTMIAPAGLGPEINGAALNGILAATRPESLAPWLGEMVADRDLITPGYAKAAMTTRRDPHLQEAQRQMADRLFPDGVQAFDLRAALARLNAPARIIWGKRDAIIPWQHAMTAPGPVALHLFDDIGHIPQFECPEALARIIGPY